jgi:hypothetical protein
VHHLLTVIYHLDIVYPQTLETITTFAAARKYGMRSVLALFRTFCSRKAPIAATGDAFRAYIFALDQGLIEEALEAAHLTLSLPQHFEKLRSKPLQCLRACNTRIVDAPRNCASNKAGGQLVLG